jgi:hypothetical protein
MYAEYQWLKGVTFPGHPQPGGTHGGNLWMAGFRPP